MVVVVELLELFLVILVKAAGRKGDYNVKKFAELVGLVELISELVVEFVELAELVAVVELVEMGVAE